ncbi:WhiB family transcriptional regulator [Nitriliruptor alkaliphilus]|uniref:WhiB family transcriptional regulator n=1 Tax=Nitriliruptor alkaliphilus TaxID=427918 RepID=UPI000698706F|nr:WhiB family transcriptional regulator [Nitriliruptor alkaliphilus]
MTWHDAAACLDEDPELFFPGGDSPRYAPQVAAALEVCAACAVTVDCLRYALDHGQNEGIWGGMTAVDRAVLRRRSARAQPATASG